MNKHNQDTKVSVLFITYNHAKFVADALDSVLMQKTNFPVTIILGDDGSTDGTREIILDYAARYPHQIELSNPPSNIGAEKNFNQLLEKCIAPEYKYMAYLEGDDYWMDELRLQKQFDILENDNSVGMVYGKYKIINNKQEYIKYTIPLYKSGNIFEDIITCKYLPALHAALFRTPILREIFAQPNFMGADFYIMAELAKNHQVIYTNQYFFVYRQTAGSITKIQAGNVTQQFKHVLNIYKTSHPNLVKKGLRHGGLKLLYNQSEDNPSYQNLFQLIRHFKFSIQHQKQIVKWFYLRLKNFLRTDKIAVN